MNAQRKAFAHDRHLEQLLLVVLLLSTYAIAFDIQHHQRPTQRPTERKQDPMMMPILPSRFQETVQTFAFGCLFLLIPLHCAAADTTTVTWQLGNGPVQFTDPLVMAGRELSHPKLLGSGGGGAVFSFQSKRGSDPAVAVKVSWIGSSRSVENECQILKTLERSKVPNVEVCLDQAEYPSDPQRVMIALQPVFDNDVSSIIDLDEKLQPTAIRCIVQTLVQMLAANVVMTDVQPLLSKTSGRVLFVDFTEAQEIDRSNPTFLDRALAASFCSEMLSLVPEESLQGLASQYLLEEIKAADQSKGLPPYAYELLLDQTGLSKDLLNYVDARVAS